MDHPLNVHLIRSKKRKKTISLRIKKDGRIVLYVPYHTPKGEIEGFRNKAIKQYYQNLSAPMIPYFRRQHF